VFINEDNLKQHVRVLSEELVPRTCELPLLLERSAQYVKEQFLEYNSNVYSQTYNVGENEFSNIVSSYGPETGGTIIVGAHYDAYARYPGADDNASGVAGLLELGRVLGTTPPDSRIVLVAYSCEEPPYFAGKGMGSYVHAKSVQSGEIKLMISLEMIGYFTGQPESQKFPVPGLSLLYPDRGNYVAVVGAVLSADAAKLKATINGHTNIEAFSINAPRSLPGVDFSDHRNYWSLNIPAVMVTDTAFYRNQNYHTAYDTFDTLDYNRMSEVVYGVYIHVTSFLN